MQPLGTSINKTITTLDTSQGNFINESKAANPKIRVESNSQFGFLLNSVNLNKTSERLYSKINKSP